MTPVVHLVGAGLGTVGSLTRRAARLLGEADVVVLDRPSLEAVVALAPPAAARVQVGRGAPG
nr:SAM-dependent methyltransferase [Aquihabitans sp.]